MKKLLILSLLFLGSFAYAGTTASHTVNVNADDISTIELTATTPLTLLCSITDPGAEANTDSDSSTYGLEWSTNLSDQKITVQTSISAPLHQLDIVATGVTKNSGTTEGTAASTVTFGPGGTSAETDLITAITDATASCGLTYTGTCLVAEGEGDDSHTITYTIKAS